MSSETVIIKSATGTPLQISLKQEYPGIGRTLYLPPKRGGEIEAPAEIAKEPEVLQYARKKMIHVHAKQAEKKARKESKAEPVKDERKPKRKGLFKTSEEE